MTDHLSERDWKAVLNRPENRKVDGRAVADALKRHAKVPAPETAARIQKAALALRAEATSGELLAYLDEMIDAASTAQEETGGGEQADLKSLLVAARMRSRDKPMHFVAAPGKQTGLVVSRRATTTADLRCAKEQRGEGGAQPVKGLVYGRNGVHVFEVVEGSAPKGLGKQLRRAIREQAELNLRLVLREGDQETDDDHDAETPAVAADDDALPARIARFAQAAEQVARRTPADPRDALEQFVRSAKVLTEAIRTAYPDPVQQVPLRTQLHTALELAKSSLALAGTPPGGSTGAASAAAAAASPLASGSGPAVTDEAVFQRELAAARRLLEVARGAQATGSAAYLEARATFQQKDQEMQSFQIPKAWKAARAALAAAVAAARRMVIALGAERNYRQDQATAARAEQQELQRLAGSVLRPAVFLEPGAEEKAASQALAAGDAEFQALLDAVAKMRRAHGIWAKVTADPNASRQNGPKAIAAVTVAARAVIAIATPLADKLAAAVAAARSPAAAAAAAAAGPDPRIVARQARCDAALKAARHFLIGLDIQQIGAPGAEGWDEAQRARVMQLRAQIAFETGNVRGSSLKEDGSAGVNEAYWVESKDPGAAKAAKNFLFKPLGEAGDAEERAEQVEIAAREALASASARLIERMTGIALGVPQTSVVALGGHAFATDPGRRNQTFVGSLQQFEPTDGELFAQPATVLQRMPASECQRMAVLDIIHLNCDRHMGNFLVRMDGGTPAMVPIDHGDTLPSQEDFRSKCENIGGMPSRDPKQRGQFKNALLAMPGSYQPFGPEMLERLHGLDPDALVQGMREQLDSLDRNVPNLGARDAVKEDRLLLAKRSAQLLKMAAATLSPAEIQLLIGRNPQLLTGSSRDFDRDAPRLIAEAAGKGRGYAEFFTLSAHERKEVLDRLEANGWPEPTKLLMQDPVRALHLFKADVKKGDGDVAAAAASVSVDEAAYRNAERLFAAIERLLAACEEPRTSLAARLQRLRTAHAARTDGGPAHEQAARDLHDAVLTARLEELERKAAELFATNLPRFQRGSPYEIAFRQCLAKVRNAARAGRDLGEATRLATVDMPKLAARASG